MPVIHTNQRLVIAKARTLVKEFLELNFFCRRTRDASNAPGRRKRQGPPPGGPGGGGGAQGGGSWDSCYAVCEDPVNGCDEPLIAGTNYNSRAAGIHGGVMALAAGLLIYLGAL